MHRYCLFSTCQHALFFSGESTHLLLCDGPQWGYSENASAELSVIMYVGTVYIFCTLTDRVGLIRDSNNYILY